MPSAQFAVVDVLDVRPSLLEGAHLGRVGFDADGAEPLGRSGDKEGKADIAESDHPDGGQVLLDLVSEFAEV